MIVLGGDGMEIISIESKGANTYVLKEGKDWILVDVGQSYDMVIREMKKLKLTLERLKLVIITHAHSDHVKALSELKEKTGCKVLVHREDKESLEKGYGGIAEGTMFIAKVFAAIANNIIKSINLFPPVSPDIIIEDSYDLSEFGFDAQIISTPGHTKGSISIVSGNEAIVGDVFFNIFPKSCVSLYSNDKEKLLETCVKLLDAEYDVYYLGHGRPLLYNELEDRFENLKKRLNSL